MSGITNSALNNLTHNNIPLNYHLLKLLTERIWYSTSEESYIQRTTFYDGSIFDKSSPKYKGIVDKCTLAIIYKSLELNHIKEFEDCAESVENDFQEYYQKEVYFLSFLKSKNSSFYEFSSKIRNSIAHGTFNILTNNKVEFVGQFKPKQESKINFIMRISNISLLEVLFNNFKTYAKMTPYVFLKETYQEFIPFQTSNNKKLYSLNDGYLFFDVDFNFLPVKNTNSNDNSNQDIQMLNYVESLYRNNNLDNSSKLTLILNASSRSMFSKTKAKYPNIEIITSNYLLKHLGIK